MAKADTEGPITLSVLDRLIDLEPKARSEAPLTRAQSLRRLKAALKRDLEWLLNTRRTPQEAPASSHELDHSLYHYGLPDFTGLSLRSSRDQQKITKMLESAIARFEPRLANVRVRMAPVAENARLIRFVIEGLLRIDPAPERVSFDTVLELSSGQYQVMGEPGAR